MALPSTSLSPWTVEPATPALLPVVAALFGKQMGSSYVAENQLVPHQTLLALSRTLPPEVIGALTWEFVADEIELDNALSPDHPNWRSVLPLLRYPVLLIGDIATTPKWQRKGVAKSLLDDLQKEKLTRYRSMLATAWLHSDTNEIPFAGLAAHAQMLEVARIPNYWTADGLDRHLTCPACNGTCHCTAVIYLQDPHI